MNQTLTILNAVLPVFGVMGLGIFIRKLNWLTEEADNSLMRICVNVLLPCLILDKSLGNPALKEPNNLLLAPLLGYAVVGLAMLIAFWAKPLHGLSKSSEKRTFAVGVGLHNYGYVPLPLALLLFDQATAGVLFLHIVGVEMALWTLGVMVLSGGSIGKDWRRVINGPLIAIVLAVILNALGWNASIPAFVGTGIHWLGGCAIPLALILIGAIMADHLGEFHSAHGWRVISSAIILRIGVFPLLFLALAKSIPMTVEHQRVLVLQAAMPTAVFPIVLAKLYKGDPATAMRVVLSTSVISLITIPLWIRFGLKMLGL
ncbi:MAG: AEC family transporter [Verrucomicrobiota bacterium]